jgi:hypothetical protein
MHDTSNNIGMTWSNGKSPKFSARSSQGFKWIFFCHKGQILLKILIRDLIKKKDLVVGNKIMIRCIGFRSTAAISYAQIQ